MTLQVLHTVQPCTLLCSKRPLLAKRCSELRPGLQKSLEISVAQSMHSMHSNACMCCKVLHFCSLKLVHLTVGRQACHFLYKPIKYHNITSKVQRWQSSWEKVKPESCAEVSLSRTIRQFNESWENQQHWEVQPRIQSVQTLPNGDHCYNYIKQASQTLKMC